MSLTFWLMSFVLLAAVAGEDSASAAEHPPIEDGRIHERYDLDHPVRFKPMFRDRAAWDHRAAELRRQILVAEGLWPLPNRESLDSVVHGRIERAGYTVERVYFRSLPGHYVSGSLYRPVGQSGRRPGILSPHGHWPNGRFFERTTDEARREIECGAERTESGARYPLQARCAMLARMGCVVFFYDAVGVADSQSIPHGRGFGDVDAVLRLQSAMGLQTWNSIRALDFLSGLPDVDPHRIGVTGASGGGTQTFLLCAVDSRPAVAFPAVMVCQNMQGGCVCENAPLLRIGTNNAEIAALFAPKPLGMTGADDWTRDIETSGLPEIRKVYDLYGLGDRVSAKYYPFPHNYNAVSRERMYEFMNRSLELGAAEPLIDLSFVPVPPAQLSVYDADHPRPADSSDATALRRAMSAASDIQLDRLYSRPMEYRNVVRGALEAMVQDSWPVHAGAVAFHRAEAPETSGAGVESGVLTRSGSPDRVPTSRISRSDHPEQAILWITNEGTKALSDLKPQSEIEGLLDSGFAVYSADLYHSGPGLSAALARLSDATLGDAAYVLGYNRSLAAQRIHDLLTLFTFARGETGRPIAVAASGRDAPLALLACALAGRDVARCAIDLGGFDFDQVDRLDHPMLLPGAVKYGGIYGFLPLLEGRVHLWGARRSPLDRGRTGTRVTRDVTAARADQLAAAVTRR